MTARFLFRNYIEPSRALEVERDESRRHETGSRNARSIDACSLLALADLTVGAGGTMTGESAILGTPALHSVCRPGRGRRYRADARGMPSRPSSSHSGVRFDSSEN
jgi:Protein of unknown function (DUF354)